MTVKADSNDARGMAHLMRMGWFRPVHVKAPPAQEIRALLTARKLLVGKLQEIELGIRGLPRGFGLKVGMVSKGKYEARIRELVLGHPMLEPIAAGCSRHGRACGWSMPSCTEWCWNSCAMTRRVVA